jgi:phosphate starvation-inducible PhoH-like protein
MKEKLDPYMQPLYDALRDMLPNESWRLYSERDHTNCSLPSCEDELDHAFVILDEAQNTTFSNENVPNPYG